MEKNKNRFCGVDVGLKESHAAIIEDRKLISLFKFEDVKKVDEELFCCYAVGIDAPLSFPLKENLRECEKELIKMGIKLFPSGAKFFRGVAEKGMEIASVMKSRNLVVFEVYPYATRFLLEIGKDVKKQKKRGREKIISDLSRFVALKGNLNHNEIDAVISALTVSLYYEGFGRILGGKDGSILIPSPEDLRIS